MRRSLTLAEVAAGRDNNFNLIRMIAASGVLISHAFPITLGDGANEPFEGSTGLTLGFICVAIFFAISGFLITRSFDRKSRIENWISARIARLFPGLIVVSLLIALVYGPLFTTLSIGEYFRQAQTYLYVLRNVMLVSLQYGLPGVFASQPLPIAINGSLWTLVHEVACYVGVLLLGIVGALVSRKAFVVACLLYAGAYIASGLPGIAEQLHPKIASLRLLSYPFFIGMVFYVWRDRIALNWGLAAGLALAAAMLRFTPLFEPAFLAAISYLTFVVAYLPGGAVREYNRLGDYSYGMYVYAFPIQQAVVAVAGPMSPVANMIVAFPLTLACAVVSWMFVEKPSLDRRHLLARMLGFWRREAKLAPPIEGRDPVAANSRKGL